MSELSNLTFFVVAGFQKSGTTFLHRMLSQHPEISLTKQKELNYFSAPTEHDYEGYFKKDEKTRAYGDISPQYSYCYSAKNIKRYRADSKIIFIIRNKFERTVSHFKMQVSKGEEKRSFEEILKLEEENIGIKGFSTCYFHNSDYQNQILDYEKYFKEILFIKHDHLLSDPARQLEKILDFIDVENNFLFENIYSRIHVGGKQRFPLINIFKKKLLKNLKPYKTWIFKFVSSDFIYGLLHRFETEWNVSNIQDSNDYEIYRERVNKIFSEKYSEDLYNIH